MNSNKLDINQINEKIKKIVYEELNKYPVYSEYGEYLLTKEQLQSLNKQIQNKLNKAAQNDKNNLKYIYSITQGEISKYTFHTIKIHIMQDFTLIHTITIKNDIHAFEKTIFKSTTANNMTPVTLLNNATYFDELTTFINNMIKYETNRILKTTSFSDDDILKLETYYNNLSDEQKQVFAKSRAYVKVSKYLNNKIYLLIEHFGLEQFNSFFKNIEFKE
jgi:hypothetical protein